MIEIVGQEGTAEYEAAVYLKEVFSRGWPGLEKAPRSKEHLVIAADAKISGGSVSDIDIVVLGIFKKTRRFVPTAEVYDNNGDIVRRSPVGVSNIMVAVEVKDHDERGVTIEGDKVVVSYPGGKKKSATNQNHKQSNELSNFCRRRLNVDAWVYRCLVMRGLGEISVAGAVAAGYSLPEFLTKIASVNNRVYKRRDGDYMLSSLRDEAAPLLFDLPIFVPVKPTTLDRKRMDAIASQTKESGRLLESIGKKMVRLRGPGGTGKTIMCLQMARQAYESTGVRSLVLTYNLALAADIRRILALMGIPSDSATGGIKVDTVMSFMYSWFRKLQLLDDQYEYSDEDYMAQCRMATEMLSAGAISQADVHSVIEEDPLRYEFDYVIVDECQDWPQPEVDLLTHLYPVENICVADGVDQEVRGLPPRWSKDPATVEVISLTKTLRMKRNISLFLSALAGEVGLNWGSRPSEIAGGGTVYVSKEPYSGIRSEIHTDLMARAAIAGNSPVDHLFCVPSKLVSVDPKTGSKTSETGRDFEAAGFEVWNGVDEVCRRDFPRSEQCLRVVNYASCRGLEGWVVVLEQADLYWQECHDVKVSQGLNEEEASQSLEDVARHEAWRKLFIALARPIDTLLITLSGDRNEVSNAMLKVARERPDYVHQV